MPIDVLEEQIKALPPEYYEELVDYVNYLTQKNERSKCISEEESLSKMRESSLKTVWEQLKNDTW